MLTSESAIFLLVSLLSAYIINSQIQKSFLFVMLSILLAVLLVFFSRFQLSFLQQKTHRPAMLISLFLSSFFVQLLVIATGGLFSAFVIVIHLFTLGMSVLFNVSSAIVFLLLSVGLLMSSIIFDPQMKLLFEQDPWSVVLHGISFLVVIPLAHMLVSTYHLKDAVSKMLSENLKNKELQDESIFRGLGEMVFILDKNKKIIFANEAVKRSLNLETVDLVGNDLVAVLPIESQTGAPANSQTLSIDQTLTDKSAHLVKGFSLVPKQGGGRKMPVIIQIRPVNDTEKNSLKQIVVVITPDLSSFPGDHIDAQISANRRKLLIAQLEQELQSHPDGTLSQFEAIMAQINDLLLFKDLESQPLSEHRVFVESTELIGHILSKQSFLLKSLHIDCQYTPTQEALVKTSTLMHNNQFSLYSHTKNSSRTSLDVDMFETLIILLLKLLSYSNPDMNDHQIIVRNGFNDLDKQVLFLVTKVNPEIGFAINQLLLPNYGTVGTKMGTSGSGLEGVLAQKIAQSLNIEIVLQYNSISKLGSVTLVLPVSVN